MISAVVSMYVEIMDKIIIQNTARAFAIEYAPHWIGTPYIFSGDDFSGFDCSGQIMEILQAAGVERRGNDLTAHGIYDKYKAHRVNEPYAGCLICIWNNHHTRIRHIGFLITDRFVMHAGGGGSATNSIDDAIEQNAYVRCDPVKHFGNDITFIDPFLSIGG